MDINLSKEQQLILFGLVVSIVLGLGVMAYRQTAGIKGSDVEEEPAGIERREQDVRMTVHVTGAVREEGVYRLKPGDRLMDAIALAGGALPLADLSAVNLAEPIKDCQKIAVPLKIIEVKEDMAGSGTARVHINSADEKALDGLPGIGAQTAKIIIEYRRKNGPFARIEQLMEIPRFGKSKLEKIKDRITL